MTDRHTTTPDYHTTAGDIPAIMESTEEQTTVRTRSGFRLGLLEGQIGYPKDLFAMAVGDRRAS